MDKVPLGVCGMPCGLCPMFHIATENRCTGCSKDHKCNVFNCSEKKEVKSCGNCEEYRCSKIENLKEFPNFDSHRIWEKNISDIKEKGYDNWMKEYNIKAVLIKETLERYNAGSSKNLICKTFMLNGLDVIEKIMNLGSGITEDDPKKKAKEFKMIIKKYSINNEK